MDSDRLAAAPAAVPDFGVTVRRDRLLKVVAGLNHDLLVLSAPAGYGKSVLAAQIATELFDEAIWIKASTLPTDVVAIASLLAARLGAALPAIPSGDVLRSPANEAQVLQAIGSAVNGRDSASLCVVLDDLASEASPAVVLRLAMALRRRGACRTQLVVTTRSTDGFVGSGDCCLVDSEDLRFGGCEAQELVTMVAPTTLDDEDMERVLSVTGGQAALVAVVARHWTAQTPGERGCSYEHRDVRGLLGELAAAHLDTVAMRALFGMSLLRTGDEATLAEVVGDLPRGCLGRIRECIPLVRMGSNQVGPAGFAVHDMACEAFGGREFAEQLGTVDAVWRRASAVLAECDPGRSLRVVALHGTQADAAEWIGSHGLRAIDMGHSTVVEQALAGLGPSDMMRPRVLLVSARIAADNGDAATAARRSRAAEKLATEEGDHRAVADSLLLLTRVRLGQGSCTEAEQTLDRLMSIDSSVLSSDVFAATRACAGMARALTGRVEEGLRLLEEGREAADRLAVSAETRARCLNYEAATLCVALGAVAGGRRVLHTGLQQEPVSARTRELLLGNDAGALMHLGRVERACASYGQVHEHCEEFGLGDVHAGFKMVRACCSAAKGETQEALRDSESVVKECLRLYDHASVSENLVLRSLVGLAAGEPEAALSDAERALEEAMPLGVPVLVSLATVAIRASLLALGDALAAVHVTSARDWAVAHDAAHVALLADLLLAEIERLDGRTDEAVERVRTHTDYILTESANWYTAMLIRAFPGLLGVLAQAVGVESLPTHLLRMVLADDSARCIPLAREILAPEAADALARRLGHSDPPLDSAADALDRAGHASPCKVRLFGGFDVETASGPVPDRAWRKRKARLLFAMLVERRGQEVPREVITDHLWPDKEDAAARNNFHVVWSAMKGALSPEAKGVGPCPYAEYYKGICRAVTERVRSDLDDFDETVATARAAEATDEPEAALGAYERLVGIYRGDLMPADVYDDWFAATRDRYRHEFSDMMVAASRLCERSGDLARALRFARAGLAQDPWREDLYQMALGCQIASGQRSAAIETYMSCRAKLCDDLGLDPSADTVRLYEQVLAMEDPPDPGPSTARSAR